jgi:hypothetical protein
MATRTAKLSDIITDDKHLDNVFRLTQNEMWIGLRQYLSRDGVITDKEVLPDYVFYCLKSLHANLKERAKEEAKKLTGVQPTHSDRADDSKDE